MYCPSCNAYRSDADRFCGFCGTPLVPVEQASDSTGPLAVPVEEPLEGLAPPRSRVGPALALALGSGGSGELFSLAADRVTIGRSPSCDVFLDDITVSRNHAEVSHDGARFKLRDLGSLNGTYVNRRRIEEDDVLADGDEVQIGKFRLVFIA